MFFFAAILFIGLVSAGNFLDDDQGDFDQGNYSSTIYNSTGKFVQLDSAQNSGGYLSRIFDSSDFDATWRNLSLGIGLCYSCELIGNRGIEFGYLRGNISMEENMLLTHFNEVSGTLVDSSGRSNHGGSFNGVIYGGSGKFNTSLQFDGSNDRADFGDKPDFENLEGLTIEAWVNADRYDNAGGNNFPSVVDKRYDSQYSLYFNVFGNIVADIDTSGGHFNVISPSSLSTSEWHHVAFTYDGSNLKIYSDGDLVNSTTATGFIGSGTNNLLVGAGWNGNFRSFFFDGKIDEVSLYNRSLSSDEISHRYLRGKGYLNLSVRSCDDSSCIGDNFVDVSESIFQNLSVGNNRYFQYLVNFTRETSSISPETYSVDISYESQNTAPFLNIISPQNTNYNMELSSIDYTVSDAEDNLDSCWYSLDNGITNTSMVCGENITGIISEQGDNTWSVWANDSSGYLGNDSVIFFVDSLSPNVTIEFPVGGANYNNITLDLNFSVVEDNLDSCWYSLDNGITNTTLLGCSDSTIIASQGANFLIVWASDNLGNEGEDSVTFNVDSFAPGVVINSPLNLTYDSLPILFNVSLDETGSVMFSLDNGITNTSMSSTDGINFEYNENSLIDGVYEFLVFANDSLGNNNYTERISFSLATDNTAPQFFSFIESPSDGISYSSGANYQFNVTVTDNVQVGDVGIEFLGVNYSVLGSNGEFSFDLNDLAAGNYGYYWWANDSSGNYNSSESFTYTIVKTIAIGSLTNSDAWIMTYPEEITIGYTESNTGDGDIVYEIFRNNESVGGGETVILAAGNYDYILNVSSGQNYSQALLDEQTLIVERGQSVINLTLNGSESDISIVEGSSVLLNGTIFTGDQSSDMQLYLDGSVINEGSSELSNNTLFSSLGLYNVSLFYFESENYSFSSKTYFVNVTSQGNRAPRVEYNSPSNNSNVTLNYVDLNFSIFDEDLGNLTVWIYGNGNLLQEYSEQTNGSNLGYLWSNLSDGQYYWSVVAFDGFENSSEAVFYFEINTSIEVPTVDIDYPSYSSTYGDLNFIPLNFSLSSYFGVECFYNLNNGVNNTILECQNMTFSVPSDGEYNITLFAREYFGSSESSDSEIFFVKNGRPNVHLVYPEQEHYNNSERATLIYIPYSDSSISRCELWSDFGGNYELSQTDLSIFSGQENIFEVENMTEGSYLWAIGCLDGDGDYVLSGNRSLTTDYTPPNVTISEPNGTYVDTTVPLTFEVNDSNPITTCSYNLTYSVNGQNLEVNIVTACENTQITVQGNGDYNLDVSAFDAAANEGDSSTSFSVASGTSSGGSGGGGGGGGGAGGFSGPRLSYADLPGLSIKKGRSAIVSFTVRNSGGVFLNNCQLVPKGPFAGLIESNQVEDLSLGQSATFVFELGIPKEFSSGTYDLGVDVVCDEASTSIPLQVAVLPSSFDFDFLGTERDGNKLLVSYSLEELSGSDQNIALNFRLENRDGEIITEGERSITVIASSKGEYEFELDLPQDTFGEFRLFIDLESNLDVLNSVNTVILPSSGLTGLAISDANQKTLTYAAIVLAGIIILIFVMRFVMKHHKKTTRHYHKGRKFIKLNLRDR